MHGQWLRFALAAHEHVVPGLDLYPVVLATTTDFSEAGRFIRWVPGGVVFQRKGFPVPGGVTNSTSILAGLLIRTRAMVTKLLCWRWACK